MLRRRRFVASSLIFTVLASALLLAKPTFGESTDTGAILAPLSTAETSQLATGPNASVRFLHEGLTGSIAADIRTEDVTGDGTKEVFLGTSRGLYVLSRGSLLQYIPTSSAVRDIALLDDVTGDGKQDVVVAVGDTYFPNIRAYDAVTGQKVWQFVPRQEVFIENLMWTEQQTLTFDVEAVDVSRDGIKDVIATSGYGAYALDGASSDLLWRFEATDNLWKVAITPDLTGDGIPDVAFGGQNGYMHVLDGSDGSLLWEERLTRRYEARDEQGKPRDAVDRSVWDIVPVRLRGVSKAVVTSEDGKIRLVDLRDGSVDWAVQAIDYVSALLDKYYQNKQGSATSPGDFHFFNLRAFLASDVTGDGVEEVLVSAYQGRGATQGQEPRGAELLLIDPTSGSTVWENAALDLEQVGQMELASMEGRPVVLLPSSKIQVVDLQDGEVTDVIEVTGASSRRTRDRYAVKDLGSGEMLVVSDIRDALGVSTSGDVLWDYPRVVAVAVERGDFTGDETEDILVRSKTYAQDDAGSTARARVIYVVDGNTKEKVWTYAMSYEEFTATGGIGGILVTPDLDQDGKQDIVGYVQEPISHDEEQYGEESEIVAFSGKDGSVVLRQPVTSQTYYGTWDTLYRDPSALEQKIRDTFEADMKARFPGEWDDQERQRRDDFERRILDDLGSWESQWRDDFEGQITGDWEDEERDRRQAFDEQLQADMSALSEEGMSEQDVARLEQERRDDFERELQQARRDAETNAWDRFENELPAERASMEKQWRDDFQGQLEADEENMRRDWHDRFENEELPERVDEWRKRLTSEEQGRRIDKRIVSLDVMRYPGTAAGIVLLVAGFRDIFVIKVDGELLWTRTLEPWTYEDPFTGERPPGIELGLQVDHGARYGVVGDLNGDGVDDLVAFAGRKIAIGLSSLEDGRFDVRQGALIELEQEADAQQGRPVDDLDGDGVKDIAYPVHQEGRGPLGVFLSSATGQPLLELADYEPGREGSGNVTLNREAADMDGDGHADALVFQRWIEGKDGPRLRVLSTRSGEVVWDFSEYREIYLFDRYDGPIMPAASISDYTGDGVDDLALVMNLTWQPGARVEVYNVVTGDLAAQIILEDVDPERHDDPRWHPGLLARETDDFTGDGSGELVVVASLGDRAERKEPRLMVVDLRRGEVVADFRVFGTEVFDLNGTNEFGVVGMAGEVYLLNVTNDLQVKVAGAGGGHESPLTVRWSGVGPGAFNQVFIDNVEVARTNEQEVTVAVSRGEHTVTVRSLDEQGRGVYRTVTFAARKGSSVVVWTFAITAALLLLVFSYPIAKLARRYVGERERHG